MCFVAFGDFVLEKGPKHGVEALSRVPKPKKIVRCLTEKMHAFG